MPAEPSLSMWERGLKLNGSWGAELSHPSLPVWERGLKQKGLRAQKISGVSLPVWERGLKQGSRQSCTMWRQVAPCVGAWIETI